MLRYSGIMVAACAALLLWGCSEPTDTAVESPHPPGYGNPVSGNFHGSGNQIQDFTSCQECHAADYSGGQRGQSCMGESCHANSPEACNTCHGEFNAPADDTTSWAPPATVLGYSQTSLTGVGAHSAHVDSGAANGQDLGGPYACTECHILPDSVMQPGHLELGTPQAEVVFGSIANDGYKVVPDYNPDDATCTGVYCHGNFEMGHGEKTVVWINVEDDPVQCGGCHFLPPPAPHPQIETCDLCHGAVVDSALQIIAPPRHADGDADFNL